MSTPKLTPMIKQYLSIKEHYQDAILFYRMGDFYEMFFEDAEIASRVLEITLTSRNKKDNVPVPMCGFPFRAAQGYIARLLENGHKVAICDQVEDPALAKGLVKRDVVQVITPGMILDNELLDEKSNNYILSLSHHKRFFGLSYLDISTGTFRISESEDVTAILDEVQRVSPSEILFPSAVKQNGRFAPIISALNGTPITYLDDHHFDHTKGRERLIDLFKTFNLEGFGCENLPAGIGAAGALVFYVSETQKQTVGHLNKIETYALDNYLVVDSLSCQNLELLKNIRTGSKSGSLLGTIDRTVTAMGGRLLKNWLRYPLVDPETINGRFDAVGAAMENIHITRVIRENLRAVYDLERLGSKISMGQCNARDLTALKRSIFMFPNIRSELEGLGSALFLWQDDLDDLLNIGNLIENAIREEAPIAITEGGIIKTGFNSELDELLAISRDGKGWLANLEAKEREVTGISALKVRYNKVFGYYIEVPKARSEDVPPHYVRKQTLVNAERYITDELKSFESKVLNAEERRASLEYSIFQEIRETVVSRNDQLQKAAQFLSQLDCILNLAEIAEQNDYHRPEINEDGRIIIEDGRHPVIEKMITAERFVPNTIFLDNDENQVMVITGPNMAGKSTVLRQVALIVVMAQMGSFVPAAKSTICVTDRIFTRVGALDNLSQGQSTFMVEMQETANILNCSTPKSLVIMDEIGRGTSTFDGLSIAWAVAEYLHDLKTRGVKTLFATHYHELTELAATKPRVKNYNIAVKELNDDIIFLRKLVPGGTNRSYGIQVARLAGIPECVISRSKQILAAIESDDRHSVNLPSSIEEDFTREKGHRQLSLFQSSESLLIQELKSLNLETMTPIEALNCLYALTEKANEIKS